jgi:hypothetical protein
VREGESGDLPGLKLFDSPIDCVSANGTDININDHYEEARIAVDNVLDTVMGGGTPTVRLGVTGLSRAGQERLHHRAGA